MGKILQGSGRDTWTETLLRYHALIPHYPSARLIRPARIPAPPRLLGDLEQDVLLCAQAYESCCRHYYPRGSLRARLRPLGASDVAKMPPRARTALTGAAKALYELQTQPHVWCAWSVREWRVYGPKRFRDTRPATGWVYGKKRFAEKNKYLGWHSGGVESGARLVFSSAHKELIALWESMRAALCLAARTGLTAALVKKIVAERLPEREFARLARAAQVEADERQAVIDQAIIDGDYLWG